MDRDASYRIDIGLIQRANSGVGMADLAHGVVALSRQTGIHIGNRIDGDQRLLDCKPSRAERVSIVPDELA